MVVVPEENHHLTFSHHTGGRGRDFSFFFPMKLFFLPQCAILQRTLSRRQRAAVGAVDATTFYA